MSDVAAHANVSVGWVSTYVNSPDRVAPKRAERIQAAIDELGYVRNDAGRQLRRGTSSTVGFVAFDVADAFTYMVARGARRRAAEAGIRVVIADTDGDSAVERDYLQMFEEQRARGVLLSAVNNDEYLEGAAIKQPLVMIDHRNDSGRFGSVSVNNVLGGRLAVQHLLDQGRRRIAFVGGPVSIQQIADRLTGAEQAIGAGEAVPNSRSSRQENATRPPVGRSAHNCWTGRRTGDRMRCSASTTLSRSVSFTSCFPTPASLCPKTWRSSDTTTWHPRRFRSTRCRRSASRTRRWARQPSNCFSTRANRASARSTSRSSSIRS